LRITVRITKEEHDDFLIRRGARVHTAVNTRIRLGPPVGQARIRRDIDLLARFVELDAELLAPHDGSETVARIRVPRRSFAGFENEPADPEVVAPRDQLYLHLEPRSHRPVDRRSAPAGAFCRGRNACCSLRYIAFL